MFDWRRYLNLLKNFAVWSFLSFMVCDKKLDFSYFVREISNVFMHHLPDKKLKHSYVPVYEPDWLAGIVFNHSLDLTKKFGNSLLNRMISEAAELPYLHNHWIHPTLFESSALSSDCHLDILKCLYWSFQHECQQYSMPFPSLWRSELYQGTAFLKDSP